MLNNKSLSPCVILYPSSDDFICYSGSNTYHLNLLDMEERLDSLVNEYIGRFFNLSSEEARKYDRITLVNKNRDWTLENYSARSEPHLYFTLAMTLLSGSIGIGVYRLINLWIKERNGRKARVRLPNGFEVELTQASREEFIDIFSRLYKTYVEDMKKYDFELYKKSQKELLEAIKDMNIEVLDKIETWEDLRFLRTAYHKKVKEIQDRESSQTTITQIEENE